MEPLFLSIVVISFAMFMIKTLIALITLQVNCKQQIIHQHNNTPTQRIISMFLECVLELKHSEQNLKSSKSNGAQPLDNK